MSREVIVFPIVLVLKIIWLLYDILFLGKHACVWSLLPKSKFVCNALFFFPTSIQNPNLMPLNLGLFHDHVDIEPQYIRLEESCSKGLKKRVLKFRQNCNNDLWTKAQLYFSFLILLNYYRGTLIMRLVLETIFSVISVNISVKCKSMFVFSNAGLNRGMSISTTSEIYGAKLEP